MIKQVYSDGNIPVKVWTNDIEPEAVEQVKLLAQLPFIFKHISVMPDVHAGKGSTVGTVYATKDVVIPSTVGVDIGCGMAAIKTPYHISQLQEKLPLLRKYIENNVPVGFAQHKDDSLVNGPDYEELWQEFEDVIPSTLQGMQPKAAAQLGTLGGGNHFIEISIESDGTVWIMLHSGSRNIGKLIADHYIERAKLLMRWFYIIPPHPDLSYLPLTEDIGQQYVLAMNWAQKYAMVNRQVMLKLVKSQLAYIVDGRRYFDSLFEVNCHHNHMSLENHFGSNVYVTRKGAIRARNGDYGIIPGSMGTHSYITIGLGEKESFTSASHGAGRKMSRSMARKCFTLVDVEKQTEGVECRKDADIIDELPGAYKNVDDVMENQKDLVTPIHTLKQIISVKG